MRSIIVIIIAVILFAINCSDKAKNQDCMIHNSNLSLPHELFTHVLIDEDKYFIFGSVEEDIQDYQTKKITIEQAKAGEEQTWSLLSNSITGISRAVSQTEDYIFVISQEYQKKQNPYFSKHKLYRISKENGRIEKLYEWTKGNTFIHSIYFESEDNGFAFIRPSGSPLDYQLLSTVDGGRSWEIFGLERPVQKTQNSNDKLYFLSHKRNDKAEWIYSINKANGIIDSLQFELDITDFKVSSNGSYWLLGKNQENTILQHYQDGNVTDVHTFSQDPKHFPKLLYKYNDIIITLTGTIDKKILGDIGGTRHEINISKNKGVDWYHYFYDNALYIDPITFYKDERILAYIGQGKVLLCDL